jgi:hypothetical protein
MASQKKSLAAIAEMLRPGEEIIADLPTVFIDSVSSSRNPVGVLAATRERFIFAAPGRTDVVRVYERADVRSLDYNDGVLNSYVVVVGREGRSQFRVNPRDAKRFLAAVHNAQQEDAAASPAARRTDAVASTAGAEESAHAASPGSATSNAAFAAEIPDAATAGTEAALADQLVKLADLHTRGLLTDQEFAAAKSKLLG